MNIKETLKKLCCSVSVGHINSAAETAAKMLSQYADEVKVVNGSVYGVIKGKNPDRTVLLDAHIDEIAMIVTSVLDNGFIKVAKVGGIDPRTLGAQRVTVWGKEPVLGVFCSTPPHLKKDGETEIDLSNMFIDVCCEDAKSVISPGDIVTFRVDNAELSNNVFTCKSIDDRAGVVSLLCAAEIISGNREKLPVNVAFLFSDKEELGGMGASTMSFAHFPDEAIAVDVGFGDYPGLTEDETCKMGKGTMLGFSPILSKKITNKLKDIAMSLEIPFQYDVMGGRTGTNADSISAVKSGVPCGLLSVPIRNMHTTVETVCPEDIEATGRLLAEYVLRVGD